MRLSLICALCLTGAAAAADLTFTHPGYTTYGDWSASASVEPAAWHPGNRVTVHGALSLQRAHLEAMKAAGHSAVAVLVLATAERTFDAGGLMRFGSDERISTLLTPSGLPIEGGFTGAISKKAGAPYGSPFDQMLTLPLSAGEWHGDILVMPFSVEQELPVDLPNGLYRMRIDYGIRTAANKNLTLDCGSFARRPFFKGRQVESHHYSPLIRLEQADAVQPRAPWVLLGNANSNGYRGVVAEEDKSYFNISGRNLIQDDVILPLYDGAGKTLAYSLEPQVLPDTVETRSMLPWSGKGEISVEITRPDGGVDSLGTLPFVARSGLWPTTKNTKITQWKPPMYGQYTVRASGWWEDEQGVRVSGGGAYRFWIAKRMTLATATFQGQPYPVGGRYGRDLGFAPAFPAEVSVTASLYPASDPARVKTISYAGRATVAGTFGAAQGMAPLLFDEPGEYFAHILARYTDRAGHLWVSTMRHAGVVYPPDSPIVATGKKLTIGGRYEDRGATKFEGHVHDNGDQHLAHIAFPYRQGDVLLIASEGQGANKIEPTLNWEWKESPQKYESWYQNIGASNVRMVTANGYSPHLFPEFITGYHYYYASAPRPGFMGRFLVQEDGTRAPYWPTSPNSFGGQINASANGDLPGDIYRLLGGVVLRNGGEKPLYAGYMASAFILPGKSENNRVVAPGAEDLPGPFGQQARFFLVGLRPGMTYTVGATFTPGLQIDPMLPARITFTLDYPDGRRVTASGLGDAAGSFAGKERWLLDVPGVYRYRIEGEWEGFRGGMPGLPAEGGAFYVVEPERVAGVPELQLDLAPEVTMDAVTGTLVQGRSSAEKVFFAAVCPGAVLDQGWLEVKDGKWSYALNPTRLAQKTATYDTVNRVSGRPEIGDVIHLTFFSREQSADGASGHSFARVVVRGTRMITVR